MSVANPGVACHKPREFLPIFTNSELKVSAHSIIMKQRKRPGRPSPRPRPEKKDAGRSYVFAVLLLVLPLILLLTRKERGTETANSFGQRKLEQNPVFTVEQAFSSRFAIDSDTKRGLTNAKGLPQGCRAFYDLFPRRTGPW